MQKVIICKSNTGFEDILSVDKTYNRIALGVNSVLIEDDKGKRRWVGQAHFYQL